MPPEAGQCSGGTLVSSSGGLVELPHEVEHDVLTGLAFVWTRDADDDVGALGGHPHVVPGLIRCVQVLVGNLVLIDCKCLAAHSEGSAPAAQ